ncbi:hypothetical protein PT2222_130184 [Paraburkholderia tropica]
MISLRLAKRMSLFSHNIKIIFCLTGIVNAFFSVSYVSRLLTEQCLLFSHLVLPLQEGEHLQKNIKHLIKSQLTELASVPFYPHCFFKFFIAADFPAAGDNFAILKAADSNILSKFHCHAKRLVHLLQLIRIKDWPLQLLFMVFSLKQALFMFRQKHSASFPQQIASF